MRFVRNLLALSLTALALGATAQAQPVSDGEGDVGIGTLEPAASSILDLTSTTKGFLVPRMTTTQRNAIVAPADALMIFNTTTRQFEYYDAIALSWQPVGSGGGGAFWALTGNFATTTWDGVTGNYLGTNDAQDLAIVTRTANAIDFWTNNTQRAVIDAAGNVGINEIAPSARLDVVETGAQSAIEGSTTGTGSVASFTMTNVANGSDVVSVTYDGTGNGVHVVNGFSGILSPNAGVFSDVTTHDAVTALSNTGRGVVGGSLTNVGGDFFGFGNTAGQFQLFGGTNPGVVVNDFTGNIALQVNDFGTGIGIELNGAPIDGDDAANFFGNSTDAQQLTVRGDVGAIVGQTLAGNPAEWDLVVLGDLVTTGIQKIGGSMWLDGTSALHNIQTNAPLIIQTTAGNIEIDAAAGTTTVDDNLIVTGTSDLRNSLINTGGLNGGVVHVNDALTVTGATNLTSTLTVSGLTTLNGPLTANGAADFNSTFNADGAATFTNSITQTGGGAVTFSGITTVNNNLNVNGIFDANNAGNQIGNGLNVEQLEINGVNGGADELDLNGDADVSGDLSAGSITLPTFTQNSVIFAGPGGTLAQDNASFNFNDATNLLTVASETVTGNETVNGNATVNGNSIVVGTSDLRNTISNTGAANSGTVGFADNVTPVGAFSLGTDLLRWTEAYVLGGSVHIGPAGGEAGLTELDLGYAAGTGSFDINGGTDEVQLTTTLMTLNVGLNQLGGGQVTFSGNVDANGGLDVVGGGSLAGTFTGSPTFTGNPTFTNINVDGGTIDGTTIGGAVPATGTFSTLNANSGGSLGGAFSGNPTFTGDPAFIGNPSFTTGTVSFFGPVNHFGPENFFNALQFFNTENHLGVATFSNIDVNGGTIDGTPIGSAVRSTGAFTTISTNTPGSAIGSGADALQLTVNGANGGVVDMQVIGDLDITGALTAGSFAMPPLSGDLDLNGNDIVDNIDGIVGVDDDLQVTGSADVDGGFNADGAATFGSTMNVTGATVLGGNATLNGNAEFNGSAQFDGATTFNASSTWTSGNNITLNNGTITANKTAAGSAIAINNTNATTAIALNVAPSGGRTILSYGTGAGVIPSDVSIWNATGNVTLPASTENGQMLYVVNSSGGAITVTGVTGGTAAGFNNNDVRGYIYAGGWYEMP